MTIPRVVVTVGTRPEAIKMAPVIRALRQLPDEFQTVVVATGQHRQMLDQVLKLFEIAPDLDLDLMRPDQELASLTSSVLQAMQTTLQATKPDLLLVQGDTTTVFAAALSAFYLRVPVAHVEAGLRSHDIFNPFPEEANRRLTTALTELQLAPTPLAREELLREGVPGERIVVTGNTVVDALLILLAVPFSFAGTPVEAIPLEGSRLVLVTSHRRESWGDELESICLALKDLASRFPDIEIIYPVHLNPNVQRTARSVLERTPRVHLLPPVDYLTFVNLMRRAHLILTDSGGVQEEAPTLQKPVLVLRKLTERPEASRAGMAKVVGTSRKKIVAEAARLLSDADAYRAMAAGTNPYGDGRAASRIVEALRGWAAQRLPLLAPVQEFQPPG